MNFTTVVIGILALLFGIYTLNTRSSNPEKFGKLNAMQEQFGEKRGAMIHLVSYSIVPIIAGMIFLFAGFMGVSFF